jgi:neutral amino acid transport system ATP-binding protein
MFVKACQTALPPAPLPASTLVPAKIPSAPIGIGSTSALVLTVAFASKCVPLKGRFCPKKDPICKVRQNNTGRKMTPNLPHSPQSAAPLLTVDEVHAGYVKDLDILQGVNFKIYSGELVVVIGPNGAGKSTLAKAIFGLLTPHRGKIIFDGNEITGLKSNQIVKRGMCYVPQISNVFPSLSVEENLEMGAFVRSGSTKQLKQRIFELFPRLVERRSQRAGTLSGGERQQLAMGRALMLDPQLLILDEPSAALSPQLVNSVFELIQQINREGISIILVEQNARKALAMADRGYVLESGRDRFEGAGTSLLNDPKVGELYLGMGSH